MDSVLFVGDVHIKFNNLEDVEVLENKILEQRNKNLSFIVLAGDILDTHERVHTQLLNRAYKLIESCASVAQTYVLVGNHDYINNMQMLTSAHWMNGMKKWPGVVVVDRPVVVEGKKSGAKFICVPYVPPGRLVEALDTISEHSGYDLQSPSAEDRSTNQNTLDWRKEASAVFAHQEIRGCRMGAIVSSVGDEWDVNWPVIISGHIHDRQKIGRNVVYPGSSLNHAFGNDNQGIVLFDFDGVFENERCVLPFEKYISLGLEKKKLIYTNVKDVFVLAKKLPKLAVDATAKVTVCVSGNATDIKIFKKSKTFSDLSSKARVRFVLDNRTDQRLNKITNNNGIPVIEDRCQTSPSDVLVENTTIPKQVGVQSSPFWKIAEKMVIESNSLDLQKDFVRIKTQCQRI